MISTAFTTLAQPSRVSEGKCARWVSLFQCCAASRVGLSLISIDVAHVLALLQTSLHHVHRKFIRTSSHIISYTSSRFLSTHDRLQLCLLCPSNVVRWCCSVAGTAGFFRTCTAFQIRECGIWITFDECVGDNTTDVGNLQLSVEAERYGWPPLLSLLFRSVALYDDSCVASSARSTYPSTSARRALTTRSGSPTRCFRPTVSSISSRTCKLPFSKRHRVPVSQSGNNPVRVR